MRDSNDSTVIGDSETVDFSGQGNVSIVRDGNTVKVSGTDQDLSSYATTSYVNTTSGNLQSQITSNNTDINTVSGIAQDAADDVTTVSGIAQGASDGVDIVSGVPAKFRNEIIISSPIAKARLYENMYVAVTLVASGTVLSNDMESDDIKPCAYNLFSSAVIGNLAVSVLPYVKLRLPLELSSIVEGVVRPFK